MKAARPYQTKFKNDIYAAWGSGAANVMGVLPTGGGKTVVFGEIIAEFDAPSCAIAHRQELVGQISIALARERVRHRIIAPQSVVKDIVSSHIEDLGSSFYDPSARAAVAGVDTIIRGHVDQHWLDSVRLWVQDEAHHVLKSNKWGKACGLFTRSRGLGMTATPARADGRGLGRHADGLMDALVEGPPMRHLIDSGYLTDYKIFCHQSDIDLSSVPTGAGGDYSPDPLRKAVHKSRIVGDIVEQYGRHALGRLGVTFTVDVEGAAQTAARFRSAGITAEVISAETPGPIRRQILRKFRRRDVMQLVNVDLFGEGFDLPAIECVSMGRPTQSFPLYAQQFGRTLRLLEGKKFGIIIDHVGNVVRHQGPPDRPRPWTLDSRERKSRAEPSDAIPIRVCPECAQPHEADHTACPYCGYAPVPRGRSGPDQVDGDLTELDPDVLRRMRGEIERIDAPAIMPGGIGPHVESAIHRRHAERQAAQYRLRESMALWAGIQQAAGMSDARSYRRFYHLFGVDAATAQALNAADAEALKIRIDQSVTGG